LKRTLYTAFQYAIRKRRIFVNPVVAAEEITVPKKEIHSLTDEQVHGLFEVVSGDLLEPYWRVMFTLGLRPAEAMALRWDSDIDLENKTLTVNADLVRPQGGGWNLEPTKTPQSQRTFAIPDELVSSLLQQRSLQAQSRLLAGERWQDHGLVFTSAVGTPLHSRDVRRKWAIIRKEVGIPADYPMYCARHTVITAVALKLGIESASAVAGHSSTRITEEVYANHRDKLRRNAVAVLGNLYAVAQ
jgi:integrase